MTVSMQITKRIYQGNGVTRKWDIDFPLISADHLRVYLTSPQGAEEEIFSNYAVDLLTHTLTYPIEESGKTPLADGWKITLLRSTPLTQEIDLLRQGELDAEVLEEGYDKLTLLVQELGEKVNRSIKYPVSSQESDLETENFLANILSIKQDALLASAQAAASAQQAQQTAGAAQQSIADAVTSFETELEHFDQTLQAREEEIYNTSQTYLDQTTQQALLAQKWATKTDGPVEASSYSAKKYAQDAASSALEASFQNKISNCLSKIPQDINLQLSNGTLTLKAGSKVYLGNGTAVNINQDISMTYPGSATVLVCASAAGTSLQGRPIENCGAGTSDPQNVNSIYFDTAAKVVKFYPSSGTASDVSLPVAICTANGQIASIDQLFNGFGFIGNTMFALPGVSGLIPNGRNSDGTLNNNTVTVSSLRTLSFSSQSQSIFGLTATSLFASTNAVYNAADNKNYSTTSGNYLGFCNCGTLTTDSVGNITSLFVKLPFHALDYNSFENVLSGMDYVVDHYADEAGNWYRVYKSGWVEQGGLSDTMNGSTLITVTFLKPMADANYATNIAPTPGGVYTGCGVGEKTSTSMQLANTSQAVVKLCWFIMGQGA